MIISLDKYKKTGQLKPEEELHIELTENGVFEYLPPEGSVYSKAIVTVNVTSIEIPSGNIEDGLYLIVSSDNRLVSSEGSGKLNAVQGSTFVHPDTSVAFDPVANPDTSIITDDKLKWSIVKDEDKYYIYNIVDNVKMYMAWDSSKYGNHAQIQTDVYPLHIDTDPENLYRYKISIIDNEDGRYLQRNNSNEYFAFYSSVQKGSVYLIKISDEVKEPEPEGDKPEISFTGLTLYPGVEYMMVGETYDMTFETGYEPGTYEISTQQYPVEVDYDNKVLRITPTGSGLTEFCMYNYNGDIYEGERYLEVQVPAKYKAQVDIGVLEFTSNYCVNYEISEEVENYWFEIDNCAVETNQEEKCIYVTPEYNGVLTDSNNVRLCWDSNVGVCHATLNELPPFTVPEDFPAIGNIDASSWWNGDTVGLQLNYALFDENRPLPTIQVWNREVLVHTDIANIDGGNYIELQTSDLSQDYFEIVVTADYNGNKYDLMGIWVHIDGWVDNGNGGDDSGNIEIDTAKWGNPDEAQAVSWTEFEAAEPVSINSDTGEVSNAQWYELTGTLVCAPQMETGRWILGDPDGTFSQNLTDDSGNLRERSIFINRLEATPVFPGDGVTIKIKTLKHVATIEEAGLSWLHGPEGEIIFGGSYKDSPAAIYVSGPDKPDVPDIIL